MAANPRPPDDDVQLVICVNCKRVFDAKYAFHLGNTGLMVCSQRCGAEWNETSA